MDSAQSDALKRAIEYLGAVEVAPGRYAFPSKVEPRWFTCGVENIALCEPAAQVYFAPVDAGRSFFGCKITPCVLMPPWWKPEQRFAVKCLSCGKIAESTNAMGGDCALENNGEIITASLETGEKVPA